MESRSVFFCGRRAFMGRCLVSAFFAPLASAVIAGVLLSSAQAQLTGDAELLKTAAVMYRANSDQLRTWRGRVAMTQRSHVKGIPVVVEASIEFAYDRATSAKRWIITTERDVERINAEEKPRLPLERRAGMFRDGAYYEAVNELRYDRSPRQAFIQVRPFMKAGWSYGTFDPMYFWTYEGADLGRYWKMIYENVNNPKSSGAIVRNGGIVAIMQDFEHGVVKGLYELDVAQGWNLTRLETMKFKGKEKIGDTVLKWRWTQVHGVWVPAEATKDHVSTGEQPDEYHISFRWTTNIVNEPLAKDEFSLVKLGLRRGDRVNDTRTKKEYVIEDASFPPNPGLAEPKK